MAGRDADNARLSRRLSRGCMALVFVSLFGVSVVVRASHLSIIPSIVVSGL